MRDDYLTLAEAEQLIGGDVGERRKRIQDAGKAGKLPWTVPFDPVTGLRAARFVQPADWLGPIDWAHSRLRHTPPGFEVQVSRKDWAEAFGAGEARETAGTGRSQTAARQVVPERELRRWLEKIIPGQVRAGNVQPRDDMQARAREDLGNVDRAMFRRLRKELLPPECTRPGPKRR